jgi:uncharacterized phage infection (PIP) family protein YhgE
MASDNEIERLTVTLEADYKDFLKQIDRAVDEAVKRLKETEEAPKKAKSSWEDLRGFLSGQFTSAITGVGAAIVAAFSVQAVMNFVRTLSEGLKAITGGFIATNQQFETFRVQFETLLGSQSEAQKRIDELAKFGVETPFELSEIVQADRLLQTFGGTALATGDNLRRIGDSAAAVNAGFQEVSFWTGRMYSAMMGGQPFGEASMRLQELGIMSGDVRQKLEEMQKSGADGAELWAYYASVVDEKFGGAMDRLSKTLGGVMSNLADFKAMLLREGGEEYFEGVREDAIRLYDVLSAPEAQKALTELAKAFGSIVDTVRQSATSPILDQLEGIEPEKVSSLAESLGRFADSLANLGGAGGEGGSGVNKALDSLSTLTDTVTTLVNLLKVLEDRFNAVSTAATGLAQGSSLGRLVIDIKEDIELASQSFGALDAVVERFTGKSLAGWSAGLAKASGELAGVDQGLKNVSSSLDAMNLTGAPTGAPMAPEGEGEDFTEARERFEKYSQEFLDAQSELDEQRAELEKDHGEKVADITEKYGEQVAELEEEIAERRSDIVADSAKALADLEEEGAERRQEIAEDTAKALAKLERDTASARADAIAGAQEDLAELEEDTQGAVAEVQEEAREEERRATEDHQREMRRLQEDYLLNLEDAVKNRDARAIVDLRRKYEAEKREKTEDFETQRSRAREEAREQAEQAREAEEEKRREIEEALAKQLEAIEENEAEKRAQIEANQQEQLAELAETEAEKREEIAASQEEQLAKLAEHEAEKRAQIEEGLAEALAAEQESYTERQAALDEALQKRLEAVAQQLADEKDITEEGAEAILETLNEYYGVGGRMDQVTEGYRDRQRAQQRANANFDANLPGGGPGGGEFVPAGSGGGAGLPAFAEGGIVPGPINRPRKVIAHGGELIVPYEEVSRHMDTMRESMAMNFTSQGEMDVNIKLSGSAPPGIGGSEIEAIAGTLVKALNEAGIRAKRR